MSMVDLTCTEIITFSPAKFISSPVYLNQSSQVQSFQDTLRIPVEDTLRVPGEDTLQVPGEDTLRVPGEDTLRVPGEDTLQIPVKDISGASDGDTLNVEQPGPVNDSLQGTSESIWERIDARDREIEADPADEVAEQQPELRVQSEINETVAETSSTPAKPSLHDASGFLDTSTNITFFRDHVFPVKDDYNIDLADSPPVFAGPGGSNLNNSSSAYNSYIEAGQEKYLRGEDAQHSTTWIPGMIILSFLLLTWIKLVYVQFLTPVLLSTFNYKEAFKLYGNKNASTQNTFFILHLIFVINGGLFLFFVTRHFEINISGLSPLFLFLSASASLIVLFAAKSVALSIISFLFDKRKLFAEYKHNISLYTKIFGILLLPVIIGLMYANQIVHTTLIYTGIIMGGIFYLLQLVRGLEIIVKKEFSLFYLILYLCAFEILPIFILIRLIQTFLI